MITTLTAALTALARRLAQRAWEVFAILDLFRRSAQTSGRSFLWAGAYGAARWGVSRRSADRLIHWLEDLGHLEVIDRGDRHTPRTVRMHLIPLEDVDPDEIRKSRLEICRRWDPVKACAHSTSSPAPVLHTHCPIALSDDPDPCRAGSVTPDPLAASELSRGRLLEFPRPVVAEDAATSSVALSPDPRRHLRLIVSAPPATATATAPVAEVLR